MLFKALGNTRVKVSAVGQGTIGAGSYEKANPERIKTRIKVFERGIELGMTFMDTGEDYENGLAEELLGKAIKGKRDKVFISSKFKPVHNSFTGVQSSLEGSLKRLNTDYIDLYQIQWPNSSIPISETMLALSALIEKGKIKFAGVCNFTLNQLKEAQAVFQHKIVSIQTEYNLQNRSIETELLPYCQQNKITVIAYNLFSQGSLNFSETERRKLETLAAKYRSTVPQIIINWIISQPGVIALTNTMNPDHLKENARAADFRMDDADLETIGKTFKRNPVMIPTSQIRVSERDADATHIIYTSLEEAKSNAAGVQPSPAELAEEIKKNGILRPVELVRIKEKTGLYQYELIHGRNRYWAWIIAYGHDKPIPAYIINGKSHSI